MRGRSACDSHGVDRDPELGRNATPPIDVRDVNERLGARMFTSPVPIYLGCAGLIVGSLGLGAHHMLGGSSAPPTTSAQEQPLFARSVEEAALPATRWPSQSSEVAFYEPMVELLTIPARTAEPSQPVASNREEAAVAAPREAVRDVQHEPVRPAPRRAKNPQKNESASSDPSDRRASRERARQRAEAQDDAEARKSEPRRTGRRSLEEDSDPVEIRSRSEPGGRRVVIREDVGPEQRHVRAPEQRESFGSSPFRLFGIFEQR